MSLPSALVTYGWQESYSLVIRTGELLLPFTATALQKASPVPHLGSIVEFALVEGVMGEPVPKV